MQQQLSRNRDVEVDEILGKHEGQKEGKENGDKAKEQAAGVTEMDVEGSEVRYRRSGFVCVGVVRRRQMDGGREKGREGW